MRHYAEAHILIEPMERGTGVLYEMDCDDEQLAPNWQRLILSHLAERVHVGVLTGSELTDIKFTVVAGRAHLKHTEGGDFRQATYRAVRQGLMKVRSILLEPMYEFRIEVPAECIGRAMTDIQKMKGTFDSPITEGELVVLQGTAPVANMQGYPLEVAAYTKGKGVIACELKGYEICHNQEQVIDRCCYDPTGDIANPTGSIFCSQGSGFYVTWDQVDNYKHVKSNVDLGEQEAEEEKGHYTQAHRKVFYQEPETFQAVSLHGLADKELEDIFVRTYGEITHKKAPKTKRHVSYNVSQHSRSNISKNKDRYLLVDGYNIIFAWDELRSIAEENLDGARVRLQDILCNYQGYRNITVIVVFDAYKVKGKQREVMEYNNIFVVFTKEAETTDQYIEKTVHKMGREHEVTVATSDALEQVIIFGQGASRMSAGGLKEEIERVEKEIGDYLS